MTRISRARPVVAAILLFGGAAVVMTCLLAIEPRVRRLQRTRLVVDELTQAVAWSMAADVHLARFQATSSDGELKEYDLALREVDAHIKSLLIAVDDPTSLDAVRAMDGIAGRRRNSLDIYLEKRRQAAVSGSTRAIALGAGTRTTFPRRVATQVVGRAAGAAIAAQARAVRALAGLASCAAIAGLLASIDLMRSGRAAERRVAAANAAATRERAALEAQLATSRLEAESANRARDEFLAALGHELRTPLTPVLMAVTSALDADEGSADRSTLEMIRRNIRLEARLIDDLFDLTRLNHAGLPLELEVVDVHRAVRRSLDVCRYDVRRAGLHIVLDLTAPHPLVRGNEARLMQVFWNLIQNAARYTPSGGTLAIRSSLQPGASGLDTPVGPRLVVEFRDTGQGIAPEYLARVFNPFEQAPAPGTRRPFGLGLGLTISRGIVEGLGGQLTASSPGPGRGSTFRVELPPAEADVRANPGASDLVELTSAGTGRQAPRPSSPTVAERPLTILVVDDEPDTLRYVAHLLRERGHTVVTAPNVAAARAAVAGASGRVDLLIADVELPDGSGLDLMREVAAVTPGIALSGYGSDEDRAESHRAGFDAHLRKPVEASHLRDLVAMVARGEAIG